MGCCKSDPEKQYRSLSACCMLEYRCSPYIETFETWARFGTFGARLILRLLRRLRLSRTFGARHPFETLRLSRLLRLLRLPTMGHHSAALSTPYQVLRYGDPHPAHSLPLVLLYIFSY